MMRRNGEYEEAIKVMERSLAGRTKVLGEDHKHTLMTLNNLGNVYDDVGKLREGVEVLRERFEGEREVVGEESSEYARQRDEYRRCL